MKIALIQETEESSDGSSPTIFDIELSHHQNSKPLVFTYMKVHSTDKKLTFPTKEILGETMFLLETDFRDCKSKTIH